MGRSRTVLHYMPSVQPGNDQIPTRMQEPATRPSLLEIS